MKSITYFWATFFANGSVILGPRNSLFELFMLVVISLISCFGAKHALKRFLTINQTY